MAFLTAFSCLVGSYLPAYASRTGEEEQEVVPRVTFENEEKNSSDLYIKKNVENASEDYQAPAEDTFTFTLRLNGELANQRTYRLYGADGQELYNTGTLPGVGDKDVPITIPFKTDRNGGFELKDGQTAVFESVGPGATYEVTESEQEGYQQILPAGGAAAVGTVTAKGARAEFTNLYQPSGTGGKTRLEVRKTVSFPAGYEAPETPAFPFRIKMDGKAYANEPFVVKDTATGKEIPAKEGETRVTDAEGIFSLRGGQTAVFEEIELPKGVDALDYRVEELPLTGDDAGNWRATGSTIREGATTSPVTPVVFNNASASFAVTKRMEDGSKPDVSFTFLLTKGARTVWADASYYRYQTTGELVTEEVQKTNEDGTFRLKPGETAIFLGIAPGTVYNVSEQGDPDYIQTVPSQPEGYTDKTVADGVETLAFVNRAAEPERSLNVTKMVKNATEESPFAQDEFHFILYKADPQNPDNLTPVENEVYRIQVGDSEHTYYTGTSGEPAGSDEAYRDKSPGGFTLKAGETARFTGIAAGTYQVKEVDLTFEYKAEQESKTAEVANNGEAVNLTFTNVFTPRFLDLHISKKNRNKEVLSGAEFTLYRDAALQNPVEGEDGSGSTFVTGEDGSVRIPALKSGTYYLAETKAPADYRLLTNPIKLEIAREGRHLVLAVDGERYTSTDPQEDHYIVQKEGAEEGNDEVHITVYNSRNFALPLTGGRGIGWNLLAGAACVALLLWMSRRKRHPAGRS